MATNPLKPTKATTATPAPVAASTTGAKPVDKTKPAEKKAEPKKIAKTYTEEVTLFESELSSARSRYRETVKITFLTGKYQQRTLHLGTNTMKWEDSQEAVWNEEPGKGIKVGTVFSHISPTRINFSIGFFSQTEDVAQLAENCRQMHHITLLNDNDPRNPPIVRIVTGKRVYEQAYCKPIKCAYEAPLPDGRGWKYVKVDLEFEQAGGRDSPERDAPPACKTALDAQIEKLTLAELQKQAAAGKSKLFISCLNEAESKLIEDIIKNNKQQEVNTLKSLPTNVLVQYAVSGGIPYSTLSDPGLQDRLKYSIAYELIVKEQGYNPGLTPADQSAKAIVSGSSSGLSATNQLMQVSPNGQLLFDSIAVDYSLIYSAITSADQKTAYDEIFKESNPTSTTAAGRLNAIGGCGLSVRKLGGIPQGGSNIEAEAQIVNSINAFLTDGDISDADIIKYFRLPTDTAPTVVRKIREGRPYSSKAEFMDKATYGQGTVTGYSAWNGFVASEADTLSGVNALVTKPGVTDQEIQDAFGVSGDNVTKIKNNGRSFASKQAFLKAISGNESVSEGSKIWNTFWKKQPTPP